MGFGDKMEQTGCPLEVEKPAERRAGAQPPRDSLSAPRVPSEAATTCPGHQHPHWLPGGKADLVTGTLPLWQRRLRCQEEADCPAVQGHSLVLPVSRPFRSATPHCVAWRVPQEAPVEHPPAPAPWKAGLPSLQGIQVDLQPQAIWAARPHGPNWPGG